MVSIAAKWSLLGAMVVAWGTSPTAYGQVSTGCNAWRDADPVRVNPFTARSVTQHVSWHPDGSEYTVLELPGSVARDSSGRIYKEWSFGDPSAPKEENTSPSTVGKAWGNRIHSMSYILDCGGGKAITIYPDLGIARVEEGPSRDPDQLPFFETLAYVKRPSNAVFEDLGFKYIEGFSTHGFRVTVLGTPPDGEWNGKPIQITEAWVSDELAVTMLEIITSSTSALGAKYETRLRRSHVTRKEPDTSLFETPADFKINPPPEENPVLNAFLKNAQPSAEK